MRAIPELEVCSQQDAVQIYVYLYLTFTLMINDSVHELCMLHAQ